MLARVRGIIRNGVCSDKVRAYGTRQAGEGRGKVEKGQSAIVTILVITEQGLIVAREG